MKTPFKLKSGNTSSFKNLGSSPVKQIPKEFRNMKANTNLAVDFNIEKLRAQRHFKKGITKVKKPTSTLNRITKAFKNTPKQLAKGGKQILKAGGKFFGGKTLGIAGMMIATSSKADQPKGKKSEGEQIKALLTKHKLKGGKN
jgi:hypothetical protein